MIDRFALRLRVANQSGSPGEPTAANFWEWSAPFVLIFAVTLLAYLPALTGGPIWDDAEHITPPGLRSLLGLQRIWFEPGATGHYYPLLNTLFWLEHWLWGDAVIGYHLANVLQHALAASLVLAIVRRLELPGGLLAALIFAVHPVCVESVAWISQQENTLSAVFSLAAVLCYIGYDRERIMWQYDVAFGFFLLALLTKTTTAPLPAALMVVIWWERGRLEWRRDIAPLVPWIIVGLGAGVFTAWFEPKFGGASGPEFEQTFIERSLIAGRSVWFYLRTLTWPSDLVLISPRWTIDPTTFAPYLFPLGIVTSLVALAGIARRNRGPLAAGLLFGAMLFPILGFVPVNWFRYAYVADHFQYLACLGLIVPVAVALTRVSRSTLHASRARLAFASLLVTGLGILTWRHSRAFRDGETLYRTILERNPAAWLAHHQLGATLEAQADRRHEAIAHLRQALALKPDHAPAYHDLGRALAHFPGELPHALVALETSLQLQGDVAAVRVSYANTLARLPGRLPDAIAEYQKAIALDPEHAAAHFHLGRALAEFPGRAAEAIAAYEKAVLLNPDFFEAYVNLGDALRDHPPRVLDAIAAYQGALYLRPDHAAIRARLANMHLSLGRELASQPERRAEALTQLDAALRLRPDLEPAREITRQLRGR